ncbi:carbohydrate binding family 9 domain-containing protein [bacterium]|nr:carbohydrate binding family 9 domain-containing protein [bacterium]
MDTGKKSWSTAYGKNEEERKTSINYQGIKMNRFLFIVGVSVMITGAVLQAQTLKVTQVENEIHIDGCLDEVDWSNTSGVDKFYQFEPHYSQPATFTTTMKILIGSKYLYVAFICIDPEPSRITAIITKRDGDVADDDAVALMLDTFGGGSNGYVFVVNPLGTQKDGLLADNGRTEDFQWDESWFSACTVHDSGWTAELAIPLKSLKFDPKKTVWGINAARHIARKRETCLLVKDMVDPFRISQFASLSGLDLKDLSLKKLTLLPYVQMQLRDESHPSYEAGLGLRYNPVAQIGFEATLNPDFATIEADVEQVNLSRFEISYREKRPFFLEGNDNYSTRIRQFYSRRIGEIPWGGKVSGKLKSWKINGLFTQSDPATAGVDVAAGEKASYAAFRINRDLPKGSSIGLIGANRHYLSKNTGSIGLAATLFFTDVIGMTGQLIRSHGDAEQGVWAAFIRPSYDSQFMHFHLRYSHYGEGVKENVNPVGFIRHDDRREFDTNLRRTIWINKNGLESIKPSVNYNQIWSQQGRLRSRDISYDLDFEIMHKFDLEFSHDWEFLARYAPYFEKDFSNHESGIEFSYDSKRGLGLAVEYVRGVNYDSDLEEVTGSINLQIVEGWNVEYQFKRIWLDPLEDPEDNSWIHYIRTSYYLNKDLYFKLFYQTRYRLDGFWRNVEFDLLRKTAQVVFVWRFLPPFGSIQLAYQEGRTLHSEDSEKGRSFFAKLSWVF